jgi:molybdopterin-containing oxidoreductase family membrane subunit
MPSAFGSYWPTFWDWATTLGSFGLFFTGIFLFLRFLPIVAMSEMSAMRREREKRA